MKAHTAKVLLLTGALLVGGSSAVAANDISDRNDPDFWVPIAGQQSKCYKTEAHGTRSQDGTQFRLSPFNQQWYGDHYSLLVIKAGSYQSTPNPNLVIHDPKPGTWYGPVMGNNGEPKVISHIIVCKGVTPEPPEPPEPPKPPKPPVYVRNTGTGDLIGPKGDPWYRGVAKYTGTRRAKATLKVNGNVVFARKFGDRNPETTCTFRSGWRYILPNKRVVYEVREMGTNRVLYREVVRRTPAGNFGPLYRGFKVGVTCR